jgi:hypothetical protein
MPDGPFGRRDGHPSCQVPGFFIVIITIIIIMIIIIVITIIIIITIVIISVDIGT